MIYHLIALLKGILTQRPKNTNGCEMEKDEWIKKTGNLLKAIDFNYEHPSPMRAVIGGLEIDTIRELIREQPTGENHVQQISHPPVENTKKQQK